MDSGVIDFKHNERRGIMGNSMRTFLEQFNLLNNFSVQHRELDDPGLLQEAKNLGYVKDWEPKNGSYMGTAICTLKGRLFVRKNRQDS